MVDPVQIVVDGQPDELVKRFLELIRTGRIRLKLPPDDGAPARLSPTPR